LEKVEKWNDFKEQKDLFYLNYNILLPTKSQKSDFDFPVLDFLCHLLGGYSIDRDVSQRSPEKFTQIGRRNYNVPSTLLTHPANVLERFFPSASRIFATFLTWSSVRLPVCFSIAGFFRTRS
jgi:hypothetical protein